MGENRDIFAIGGIVVGPNLVRRGIYKGDGWCKVPLISASFGPFLADQEKGGMQKSPAGYSAGLKSDIDLAWGMRFYIFSGALKPRMWMQVSRMFFARPMRAMWPALTSSFSSLRMGVSW